MAIQICSFYSANRFYGVNIANVQEIIRAVPITPVQHSSDEVLGLINVRGEIRLLLDLSSILGRENSKKLTDSRYILFKNHVGEKFAILADSIGDVIDMEEEAISHYQNQEDSEEHSICQGVCKVKDQLMVLIEPSAILQSLEVAQ